jgi:hypothetical protein
MNDTTHVLGVRRDATLRTWLGLGAAVAAVLALVVLIAVACQDSDPGAGGLGSSPSPGAGTGSPGSGDGDGGDQGGDGQDGGQSGQPDPPGPVIESFEVVQEPQCPGGTTNFPVDEQPVVLAWIVTGADDDQVTLSIDGPGVYNTYPADGGDTITFPCEGEAGDLQEHTYLLTAVGDGVMATETITVTAEVQEVTDLSLTTRP